MPLEQLQRELNQIRSEISRIKTPDHFHNGNDFSRIRFEDIDRKKIWIEHTLYGTDAATAANYGVFYIVPAKCVLTKFQEVHQTAGTDGSAVTLLLEKLTDGVAPDSGSAMTGTVSLKADINKVQTATITTTLANRTLAAGDRLCLKDAGTLTSVANVTIMVELTIII